MLPERSKECRWNRQIPRDKVWDSEKQRKTIAAPKKNIYNENYVNI